MRFLGTKRVANPPPVTFTCAEFETLLGRRDAARTVIKEMCVSFFFDRRAGMGLIWVLPRSVRTDRFSTLTDAAEQTAPRRNRHARW